MTTLYVVTDGEYSGYHIEAVFSDRPSAEAFINLGEGQIEEWELDGKKGKVKRVAYMARTCLDQLPENTWTATETLVASPEDRIAENPTLEPQMGGQPAYVYAKSFVSEEHAMKIARDFAAQKKAERVGL